MPESKVPSFLKTKGDKAESAVKELEEVKTVIVEEPKDEPDLFEEYSKSVVEEPKKEEEVKVVEPIEIPKEPEVSEISSVNVPPEFLLTLDPSDLKRLSDKISNVSLKVDKAVIELENKLKSFESIKDTLPKVLVEEANEKITKNLSSTIEDLIKKNFGNLKEQLSSLVALIVTLNNVNIQIFEALSNYLQLVLIVQKTSEMKISMLNGKTFTPASKADIQSKLMEAQAAVTEMPLKKVFDLIKSLSLKNGADKV